MSAGSVLLASALLLGYAFWTLAQPTNILDYRCNFPFNRQVIKHAGECVYGAERDPCGRLSCLKGPGDICGETAARKVTDGMCAGGLLCCEGRCIGCWEGKCDNSVCSSALLAQRHQRSQMRPPLFLAYDYYASK